MPRITRAGTGGLSKSAIAVWRLSRRQKVLTSLLVCIVVLLVVIYIISLLYSGSSSLTVSVDKYDASNIGLSISDRKDFDSPTTRLKARAAEGITNVSGDDLPKDLDSIDGSHNGENYLAYTFYLKNTGDETVSFNYWLKMTDIKNEVDKAIRFTVYVDGVPTTYARTRSDGTGPEQGTVAFLTANIVMDNRITSFGPQEVKRFTVVIWLEGDDPDCNDSLLGGKMKSDFYIEVRENS